MSCPAFQGDTFVTLGNTEHINCFHSKNLALLIEGFHETEQCNLVSGVHQLTSKAEAAVTPD